jgi:hypothetical protein
LRTTAGVLRTLSLAVSKHPYHHLAVLLIMSIVTADQFFRRGMALNYVAFNQDSSLLGVGAYCRFCGTPPSVDKLCSDRERFPAVHDGTLF